MNDSAVLLLGENRCWSLLGFKGLKGSSQLIWFKITWWSVSYSRTLLWVSQPGQIWERWVDTWGKKSRKTENLNRASSRVFNSFQRQGWLSSQDEFCFFEQITDVINLKNMSLWLSDSVVEHRSAECEGLRFDSSLGLRIFLYPTLVTRRKIIFPCVLICLTSLSPFHLRKFQLSYKYDCSNLGLV